MVEKQIFSLSLQSILGSDLPWLPFMRTSSLLVSLELLLACVLRLSPCRWWLLLATPVGAMFDVQLPFWLADVVIVLLSQLYSALMPLSEARDSRDVLSSLPLPVWADIGLSNSSIMSVLLLFCFVFTWQNKKFSFVAVKHWQITQH